MKDSHALEVVGSVYDYLERFNYIKDLLSIGFAEIGEFYEMDIQEVETLISYAYFEQTFISSNIGNQNFFINDFDNETIKRIFFELADAEMLEILSSNIDRETGTFYYEFEITPKGQFIYENFMAKFDTILSSCERDQEALRDSYGHVVDSLNVLLDDLRCMTNKENIQLIHKAYLEAFEESDVDLDDDYDKPEGFNHSVASAYEIMLIEYGDAISTLYDGVKIGFMDPIEDDKIIVKALVNIDGEQVRKDFLFRGNDVKSFIEVPIDDDIELL